jgi:hypothetical protein
MVLHEAYHHRHRRHHHPFRRRHRRAVSAWAPAYRVPTPVLIIGPVLIPISPSPLLRGTVARRRAGMNQP